VKLHYLFCVVGGSSLGLPGVTMASLYHVLDGKETVKEVLDGKKSLSSVYFFTASQFSVYVQTVPEPGSFFEA
jgi:hypothetical protein